MKILVLVGMGISARLSRCTCRRGHSSPRPCSLRRSTTPPTTSEGSNRRGFRLHRQHNCLGVPDCGDLSSDRGQPGHWQAC